MDEDKEREPEAPAPEPEKAESQTTSSRRDHPVRLERVIPDRSNWEQR